MCQMSVSLFPYRTCDELEKHVLMNFGAEIWAFDEDTAGCKAHAQRVTDVCSLPPHVGC